MSMQMYAYTNMCENIYFYVLDPSVSYDNTQDEELQGAVLEAQAAASAAEAAAAVASAAQAAAQAVVTAAAAALGVKTWGGA